MSALPVLGAMFAQLSLLAVGGVHVVLPEMQRLVVEHYRWMGAAEFAALYALGQAAPGPNMLVVTLVGWRVGGVPGAIVATAAMVGPSSLLTWYAAQAWHRMRDRPWRRQVQAGVVPVTIGLVMAGAALLVGSAGTDAAKVAITGVTAAVLLATRLHPLLLLAAGALAGVVFG